MALEKSATTRSTPTATRSTAAPSRPKSESAGPSGDVKGPSTSAEPSTERDDAPKSSVLEPQDRVTLSDRDDDFDPDAMGKLDRTLRAGKSAESTETESAPETDSVLDPRSEDFDQQMAAHAEQMSSEAAERLEADDYGTEAARQADLALVDRSVEDHIDARDYIDSMAPGPIDSYVPEDFQGTEQERLRVGLRARREAGVELMDELAADTDLTSTERSAAMSSVMRHFEYNSVRSRQRDPVTLETVHQGGFPEEIYGAEANQDTRTNAIINHDPNKGMSPYSITFDPISKAINPRYHVSSFLKNPALLGDVAWTGHGVRDTIGRAWQSLVQ